MKNKQAQRKSVIEPMPFRDTYIEEVTGHDMLILDEFKNNATDNTANEESKVENMYDDNVDEENYDNFNEPLDSSARFIPYPPNFLKSASADPKKDKRFSLLSQVLSKTNYKNTDLEIAEVSNENSLESNSKMSLQ